MIVIWIVQQDGSWRKTVGWRASIVLSTPDPQLAYDKATQMRAHRLVTRLCVRVESEEAAAWYWIPSYSDLAPSEWLREQPDNQQDKVEILERPSDDARRELLIEMAERLMEPRCGDLKTRAARNRELASILVVGSLSTRRLDERHARQSKQCRAWRQPISAFWSGYPVENTVRCQLTEGHAGNHMAPFESDDAPRAKKDG